MPKLTLYSFWIPDTKPPAIMIAGDIEIHSLFIEEFPESGVDTQIWKTSQPQYDYGFYVHQATENDKDRFERWLESYKTIAPVELDNKLLDKGYALSYHTGRISRLVRNAKPYGNETVTAKTQESAIELVEILSPYLDMLERPDYLVAVPHRGKAFDLPTFIAGELCKRKNIANGSSYLQQIRDKQHSQKDLDNIDDKLNNVKGLFSVTNNHLFSNKVITIIDDIYRSGTTINELTKVIKESGARLVQAFVLTKTFRD